MERRHLIGVFLTSLGTLTLEVVLTRIFSVTMWYHFAFLAISLALMGSAMAGVVLYFFPHLTRPKVAERWIGWAALGLAASVPITFALYLQIPFQVRLGRTMFPADQILWLAAIYLDLTLPFFLSGLVLSLALSAWSEQAGRVYWADLTGASLGCLLSIAALNKLGGVGAVLVAGAVAGLAGLAFAWGPRREAVSAAVVPLFLVGLVWGNARFGWMTISVNKTGKEEPPRVFEKWNAHSRVTVYEVSPYPFFWAVDSRHWEEVIEQGEWLPHALLLIDAVAGTPIQEFHGDLRQVAFLRYDLTSFAYHLVESPRTLVIGPGGGRDVLAALASGAPHVTAVEVNPAVVEAVRGPFAEFAGYLYERPDVTIVVDDARGYIARSPDRYDIIQAALIDTWAAGGSGAFALSENSLYTVEAFRTYYEHLTDRGILTVSRWYLVGHPAETLRLVSTGMAGWEAAGVADPRQHVAVIARPQPGGSTEGLATVLFKRSPFTADEVASLMDRAASLGFEVLYAPGLEPHEEVGAFIAAEDHSAAISSYPLDITPATDDRPFFFNLVRFGDLLDPALSASGVYRTSMEAILILAAVLAISAGMGGLFIIFPLWLGTRRRGLPRPSSSLLTYFGALGVAFMLVEVPTIQRLAVYLGRPVYSLAVVLFSLLLFSGFGSLWSGRRAPDDGLGTLLRWLFPTLAGTAVLQGLGVHRLLNATLGWPLAGRLAVTILLLAPMAFLMGIPFPTGMRWAGRHRPGVVPWLWGINGVTSVLGSALATAFAIHVGLSATLVIAGACYGLAGLTLRHELQQAQGAEIGETDPVDG